MSLCALGRTVSSDDDTTKSSDGDQRLCDVVAAAAHLQLRTGSASSAPLPMHGFAIESMAPISESTAEKKEKKNAAAKKSRSGVKCDIMKPRTKRSHQHHRDFSVSLDEMERLMRVYGSLKCLRNRTPITSGRSTKVESVKRKFYRWFPDLEERFVRTEEGWYRPKAGHEEEIQYREAMRKGDQDCLVKKRNIRRSSSKSSDTPAVHKCV